MNTLIETFGILVVFSTNSESYFADENKTEQSVQLPAEVRRFSNNVSFSQFFFLVASMNSTIFLYC